MKLSLRGDGGCMTAESYSGRSALSTGVVDKRQEARILTNLWKTGLISGSNELVSDGYEEKMLWFLRARARLSEGAAL